MRKPEMQLTKQEQKARFTALYEELEWFVEYQLIEDKKEIPHYEKGAIMEIELAECQMAIDATATLCKYLHSFITESPNSSSFFTPDGGSLN